MIETVKKKGFGEVNFIFASSTLTFTSSVEKDYLPELQMFIDSIEHGIVVLDANEKVIEEVDSDKKIDPRLLRIVIGAIGLVLSFVAHQYLSPSAELILFIVLYLFTAYSVIRIALKNIAKFRPFDENFLMFIATVGAFFLGSYSEAIAVIVFYEFGEYLQSKAVDKSRKSIKNLLSSKIVNVTRMVGLNTEVVHPSEIRVNDIVVVKMGEMLSVDGILLTDDASFDTSVITGESVPRTYNKGEEVAGGFIPSNKPVRVKVLREYKNSSVQRIIDLVEKSSSKKARTEKIITKFSKIYTPIVVFLAAVVGLIVPSIFGLSYSTWIYRALTFLVISCPCALVLSVPLTYFGALGNLSKKGILLKGGNYLEAIRNTDVVVFDKTGTLTEGKFKLVSINPLNGYSEEEVLRLAAIAELNSSHPISNAIKSAYKEEIITAGDYREYAGLGVSAVIEGKLVKVGRSNFVVPEKVNAEEVSGTAVYVSVDDVMVGSIVLGDEMKAGVRELVSELHKRNKEIEILSGDKGEVVKNLAESIGVENYSYELMPEGKLARVEELINTDLKKVMFMGDGVNDSPVIARADVGVSMGSAGSDIAVESSDVVFMNDEPSLLIKLFDVAERTKNLVVQNITGILLVKVLFLTLATFGMATMWMAIFADVGISLLAVLNSMRILKD